MTVRDGCMRHDVTRCVVVIVTPLHSRLLLLLLCPVLCSDGSRNLAELHDHLTFTFSDSFTFADEEKGTEDGWLGVSQATWWRWLDTNVLWVEAPSNSSAYSSTPYTEADLAALSVSYRDALIKPLDDAAASTSNAAVGSNNLLVGAIQLRLRRADSVSCDSSVDNLPSFQCLESSTSFPVLLDGSDLAVALDSANVTQRRLMLAQYRPSDAFIYGTHATSDAAVVRRPLIPESPCQGQAV